MRFIIIAALAAILGLGAMDRAEAIGCLSGAAIGGAAGHMANHGVVGAIGGCVAGHQLNKYQQRQEDIHQQQSNQPHYATPYNNNQSYRH